VLIDISFLASSLGVSGAQDTQYLEHRITTPKRLSALVELGADKEAKGGGGMNPLHVANNAQKALRGLQPRVRRREPMNNPRI
jgi:hypothetical protein